MPHKERLHVRELRKSLAAVLNSGTTATVGTAYELRAFIVSVPKHNHWTHSEKTKAIAAAKKSFLAALRAELD